MLLAERSWICSFCNNKLEKFRENRRVKNKLTTHLCILMPAPFWHLICTYLLSFTFLVLFEINSASLLYAGTAPSKDAIWDTYGRRATSAPIHQKSTISNAQWELIVVQIRYRINAHKICIWNTQKLFKLLGSESSNGFDPVPNHFI